MKRYTNKLVEILGGSNTFKITCDSDFREFKRLFEKVYLDLPFEDYYCLCKRAKESNCLIDNHTIIVEYQPYKGFTFGYKSYEESENWYGLTPFGIEEILKSLQ